MKVKEPSEFLCRLSLICKDPSLAAVAMERQWESQR